MAELIAELLEELVERRARHGRNRVLVVVALLLHHAGSAEAGIFTRTEMTAGFTLATRSAKPDGCCNVESAALAADVQAGSLA